MKTLIVEDDLDSREVLTVFLKLEGFDVVALDNGVSAWEAFQRERFSLVISDWLMPDMDGLELCRKIRSLDRPYAYVILLTALRGRERYLEGMKAGADDFVTKPFDPDELRARLEVARRIVTLHARVKSLEGILPTCMYCKKVRDEDNSWVTMERFITERSRAEFSHGVCPSCYPSARAQFKLPSL